jgi:hypothetical protein
MDGIALMYHVGGDSDLGWPDVTAWPIGMQDLPYMPVVVLQFCDASCR